MPYPAHVRKHPELSAAGARAIGTRALVPYHFQPGQSGNPEGSSKSRREQIAACDRAALERTPEALATLTELMRNSLDDRVRTRAAEIIIERGLGKVREAPPPEVEEPKNLRVRIEFVKPSHAEDEEPAGPIIDATLEPTVLNSEPAQLVRAGPEIADLEEQAERLTAELAELKRAAGLAVDDDPAGPQPFARPSPPPLGQPRPTGGLYTNAQGLSGRRR